MRNARVEKKRWCQLAAIAACTIVGYGCEVEDTVEPAPMSDTTTVTTQDGDTVEAEDTASPPATNDTETRTDTAGAADTSTPVDPPLPPLPPEDDCVDDKQFFLDSVWAPVLASNCMSCHSVYGEAKDTDFVLVDAWATGFIDENLSRLTTLAGYEKQGNKLLLLKPLGGDEHGGGVRLEADSPEYAALSELVARLEDPGFCTDETFRPDPLERVSLLDATDTFRRAKLLLTGTLPTMEELTALEAIDADPQPNAIDALDPLLDEMMKAPAFLAWVRDTYNDRLLARAYADGQEAIDLLSDEDYPERFWYLECDPAIHPQCTYEPFGPFALDATNRSLAEEPLALIAYVVGNDLPFSEILTADYMVVNPLTAKVYGVDGIVFNDPLDEHEYRPAQAMVMRNGQAQAIPHAGVLTTPVYLNRFPTSPTNVNRHRSRVTFDFFLSTDVLALAERAVEQPETGVHNPTLNELGCSVCHAMVDPMAGAFQNWSAEGRYLPPAEGWFPEMRPPGFGPEQIGADAPASLAWIAERITADPRFATAAIHTAYRGLMGTDPLQAPRDLSADDYAERLAAFYEQERLFQTIAGAYLTDDENFKTIVKQLIKSAWFRAANINEDAPETVDDDLIIAEVGIARVLSPEQLDARLRAVTGDTWRDPSSREPRLAGTFARLFGAIDFQQQLVRPDTPNGVIAALSERMANEVACTVVAADFALPPAERRLFPYVEAGFEPLEQHGFEVPAIVNQIRFNLKHLHERILGERVAQNSMTIDDTYQLWFDVWSAGKASLEDGGSVALPGPCRYIPADEDGAPLVDGDGNPTTDDAVVNDPNYTLRAWMVVTSYLLSDYRFLYR